jgi:hypothetical protein
LLCANAVTNIIKELLTWGARFWFASAITDRRIEVLSRFRAILDYALAFAGFNIPRLERFCATNFWNTNAGTSFLVPDHVLQLIVDHLRLTGVIKEAFASAVIKVEEMVS